MSNSDAPDISNFEMKCGSSISDTCQGTTVPMTPAGFQLIVGEVVYAASILLSMASQMLGSELSLNQVKAINAARCAITNLGDNFWNWLAALYYAAKEFGQDQQIVDLVAEYYPHVCTCKEDADNASALVGGNAMTEATMSSCSEKAQELNAEKAETN